MMAELQKKQRARELAAMTPEQRAAEEAKNNPVVSKDAVNEKLAMLNQAGGGTQEAPKTAVMVGKGAPPPPPPPPPPPALKPPPGGAVKPPVQMQAQPAKPPAQQPAKPPAQQPGPAVQVQVQSPPVPQVQTPTSAPTYAPPPQQQVQPPPQPVQQPVQQSVQQQKPPASEIEYPDAPNYPAPPEHQKPKGHQKQQVNYFQVIGGKNLAEALSKMQFDGREDVLKLYPPQKNGNPNPHFKSIMEGFRELDNNPEEAVMYLNKKAKATQNFQRFFPNDNNAWTTKQWNDNMEKLKFKFADQIKAGQQK